MSNALTPTPEQQGWIDKFVNSTTKGGILGLGTGVGKTFVSIEIARLRNAKRVIIMAPESTFDGWASTLYWQTGKRLRRAANNGISFTFHPDPNRRDPKSPDYLADTVKLSAATCKKNLQDAQSGEDGWFFVTRELFTTQTWSKVAVRKMGEQVIDPKTKKPKFRAQRTDVWSNKREFDVAIADENQRFARKGNRGQQSWAALKADMKIASSADWFGGDLGSMWQVAVDIFGKEAVGMNYAEFEDTFLQTVFDAFNFRKTRVVGEQVPGLFASSLPLYVTAPPSVTPPPPERRYLTLSREEATLYKQLEENYVAMVDDEVLAVDIPLVLRIRLRELALGTFTVHKTGEVNEDGIEKTTVKFEEGAKSTKIDEIRSIISDHPGDHICILTHSAKWARKAARDLGGEAWTGELSKTERSELKARFLSGETKVLVAVPEAFGVGTDGLQAVCHRVVVASPSDQSLMNTQSIARFARQGQKSQVEVIELIARGSYDEGVVHSLARKVRQNNGAKGWS